jgi:hypothetical protein
MPIQHHNAKANNRTRNKCIATFTSLSKMVYFGTVFYQLIFKHLLDCGENIADGPGPALLWHNEPDQVVEWLPWHNVMDDGEKEKVEECRDG